MAFLFTEIKKILVPQQKTHHVIMAYPCTFLAFLIPLILDGTLDLALGKLVYSMPHDTLNSNAQLVVA